MTLDAVGVVEVVEGVVDRETEPGAPGDEALLDLGRNPDLGCLVENLGRHREQAHQSGAGPGPEHHLERALEGEDLRVEARTGDDVGQKILDVVQDARLGEGVGEVECFLFEQELLFVVEHRGSYPERRQIGDTWLFGRPRGSSAVGW